MAMPPSRAESLCKELHNSCEADDEKSSIQLLLSLSQPECRIVRETYTKIYGHDLIGKFDPDVSSSLSCLITLSPFERDAVIARKAIHRKDAVDYTALVEIFACRKSSHVLLIRQAYVARYRSQLELDIASIEPSHPYQKIMIALCASHKAHDADISRHIAKCDARRLYETGEGRAGAIDEAVVLEIFSKRSISQLNLTFSSYNHIYGHTYTKFLKHHDFGEFGEAVRVVSKCIRSPARYYAKVLYDCLKRTSTDKGAMERVMVSRAEVDMGEILTNFKNKYQKELKTAICESIPRGSYRDFLVAIATKASGCK